MSEPEDRDESAVDELVENGAVPIPGEHRPPFGDAALDDEPDDE